MRTFFLRLVIIVVCGLSVVSSFAQDVKSIEKQNKELMKILKKTNKLKDVEVKIEKDGYWYFLLRGKGRVFGVADQKGKIIIPVENTNIQFIPSEPEGKNTISAKDLLGKYRLLSYLYSKSEPVFHVEYGSFVHYEYINGKRISEDRHFHKLVNLNGEVYIDNLKTAVKIPGFWIVSENDRINVEATFSDDLKYSGTNIGLIKTDGTVLVPLDYYAINLGAKETGKDEIGYRVCKTTKISNSIIYRGGVLLNQNIPSPQCIFNDVRLCKDDAGYYWEVKKTKESDFARYNPQVNYNIKYKDEGEKFYEKREYENVISFYSHEGITQPWAKFYTGASLYMLGLDHYSNAGTLTSTLEQGKWAEYEFLKDALSFDLDLGKKQLESAVDILNEYIKEDSVFRDNAKDYIRFSTNYINSTEEVKKNMIDVLNKYAETKEKWRIAEIKRQREAELQANQRKTELMYGILNIFANALINSGNSRSSSQPTSTYSGSTKTPVSYGRSTTTISSDGDSNSDSAVKTRKKVKCRACGGTGFWVDERISGEEKWCDKCGKARKPHTHKTCGSCDGKGWHY